ncbi:MAG: hypothetical protein ACR2K0_09960 [Acidimicrobiales bacterium]
MNTTTRSAGHSAMARLAAARPPVADHTEGIVPRAERARLLRFIVEAPPSLAPSVPRASRPVAPMTDVAWGDPPAPPPTSRRRLLAGALAAAVVAAGLGVAGLVGVGDDAAQVTAGPSEGALPAAVPPGVPAGFAPTALPDGVVLQQVSTEPAIPSLPGSPYMEVYGRVGPEGTVEEAVAVITGTAPDFVDALLDGTGATTSPVPGRARELDIDFGQGVVARSMTTDDRTVCGTGGCVKIVEDGLSVMVLGRDLEGGGAALPAIVDGLELRADAPTPEERVDAPALVAGGFARLYQGDQIPGVSPASRTVLRYGDESGRLGVTLRLEDGRDFDPASLAWQFPETRPVEVRGHGGLLVANGLLTSVTWQERPGLTLSVDVDGFTENEAVDIANNVEEISDAPWMPVQGERPDSVGTNGVEPSAPVVVLGEGQVGHQRWQLVGYRTESTPGNAPGDVCTELRVDGNAVSMGCSPQELLDAPFEPGNYVRRLGAEAAQVGGLVLVSGEVHGSVASVRFLFDTGGPRDVPTTGTAEGLGTHVITTMPLNVKEATAVLLDHSGVELQRPEIRSL